MSIYCGASHSTHSMNTIRAVLRREGARWSVSVSAIAPVSVFYEEHQNYGQPLIINFSIHSISFGWMGGLNLSHNWTNMHCHTTLSPAGMPAGGRHLELIKNTGFPPRLPVGRFSGITKDASIITKSDFVIGCWQTGEKSIIVFIAWTTPAQTGTTTLHSEF